MSLSHILRQLTCFNISQKVSCCLKRLLAPLASLAAGSLPSSWFSLVYPRFALQREFLSKCRPIVFYSFLLFIPDLPCNKIFYKNSGRSFFILFSFLLFIPNLPCDKNFYQNSGRSFFILFSFLLFIRNLPWNEIFLKKCRPVVFILSQTNMSVPTCPFQALFLLSVVSNF